MDFETQSETHGETQGETRRAAELARKEAIVRRRLLEMQRVVVAFSGGVDSSVLLTIATDVLGAQAVAVLAVSPSLAVREREVAERVAAAIGSRLEIVATRELESAAYVANAGDRCYFCRSSLADALEPLATRLRAVVVYGAIADDLGDHRPGMVAARERGIEAPLLDAGMTKDEIRRLARRFGLENAEAPASACLASRIPVGRSVTRARLARIEAAEQALAGLGLSGHRVRDHGDVARVELRPPDLERLADAAFRREMAARLHGAGFRHAAVDLEGYRPAGMQHVVSGADVERTGSAAHAPDAATASSRKSSP